MFVYPQSSIRVEISLKEPVEPVIPCCDVDPAVDMLSEFVISGVSHDRLVVILVCPGSDGYLDPVAPDTLTD